MFAISVKRVQGLPNASKVIPPSAERKYHYLSFRKMKYLESEYFQLLAFLSSEIHTKCGKLISLLCIIQFSLMDMSLYSSKGES